MVEHAHGAKVSINLSRANLRLGSDSADALDR
jgi:hypothetical protein